MCKTPTAIARKLALITNARILVLESAELTPNVECKTIHLFVSVLSATKAIRREAVFRRKSVRLFINFLLESKEQWLILLSLFTGKATPKPIQNPCRPSPCGPNSQCREINDHAICSCMAGYIGVPPMCRPECVVSSECPLNKACISEKCADPCPGTCGSNARCNVVNHNAICSCSPGYTGDPFTGCIVLDSKIFSLSLFACFLTLCVLL